MKTKKQNGFLGTLSHLRNYFSADLATKALGFLSIPVLTRILSTSDYGVISVFNAYIAIFIILFTLNSHAAVSRYYYEKTQDFTEFFGATVILSLMGFVLFGILFLVFKQDIIRIMDVPQNVFYYIFPIVFIEIMNILFMQVYQPQKKSKNIALVNVIRAYTRFGLGVVIILLLTQDKYLGMIMANAAIGIIFAVYFFIILKPYFKLSLKLKHLKYIATYSFPLIPYALSGIILAQFDRIMINSYKGTTDAGLYSFAYNIGMLLSIFIGAVNRAFMPDYFEYMKAEKFREHDRDVDRFFRLTVFAGVGLILFGKEIGMLLAKKDFYVALNVIPLVVMGYLFFGVFAIYSRNIAYAKKTIYSSLILFVSSIVNIVLNVIFIPKYGYIAAAFTTLISYFVMSVMAWIVSKFILKLHSTSIGTVMIPLLISLPFIAGFYYVESLDIEFWYKLLIKTGGIVVLGLALFFKYRKSLLKFRSK